MSEEEKKIASTPDSAEGANKTSVSSAKEETKEKEENVEVPKKFKKIVEEIESMSVMELNELVKLLEKKFGVSAVATAVAGPATEGGEAEEKDSFTVELTAVGDSKIGVIKAVKATLGLGLKDAKDIVDGAPSVLKEGVKKGEAEEMKKAIEEAGGSVELK